MALEGLPRRVYIDTAYETSLAMVVDDLRPV